MLNEVIDKKNQLNKLSRKLNNARYSVKEASDSIVKPEEHSSFMFGCTLIVVAVSLFWILFWYPILDNKSSQIEYILVYFPAGFVIYFVFQTIYQLILDKNEKADYKKTINKKENLNRQKNKIYYQTKKTNQLPQLQARYMKYQ